MLTFAMPLMDEAGGAPASRLGSMATAIADLCLRRDRLPRWPCSEENIDLSEGSVGYIEDVADGHGNSVATLGLDDYPGSMIEAETSCLDVVHPGFCFRLSSYWMFLACKVTVAGQSAP